MNAMPVIITASDALSTMKAVNSSWFIHSVPIPVQSRSMSTENSISRRYSSIREVLGLMRIFRVGICDASS